MDVRDRLACLRPVLQRDVEGACFRYGRGGGKVVPCEHALDALHGREEVCEFRGGEVGEAFVGVVWADEDVAWEEGLEVD